MVRAFDFVNLDASHYRFDLRFVYLLNIFPFPELTLGFCVGVELISLDDQSHARYEDWW